MTDPGLDNSVKQVIVQEVQNAVSASQQDTLNRRIISVPLYILMCISYSYCSVLPKSYDRYPKEELRSVMNLFENFASKDGRIKSNDRGLLPVNKEHNNVDLGGVKPYHVYLAIKTKEGTVEEEQTTDKRVQDRGIDYWLGGGRFGKRYYDYGLTKTRFGRSVDHIDLNEDADN